MKKITAERILLLATYLVIILCMFYYDLTLVRESTLEALYTENANLKAENIVLEAENASLKAAKESLLTYTSALLKDNNETKEFVVSRGVGRISESLPQSVDDETMLLVKKLELENRALQAFYTNTTGDEIKEIREVKIESTMFTNAEGAWPSDSVNYGMMANGVFTHHGAVAAPKDIPFGSTVLFTSEDLKFDMDHRVFSVGDRGGRIINDKGRICIDIWTDSLDQANAWGRNKDTEGFIIIPKGK